MGFFFVASFRYRQVLFLVIIQKNLVRWNRKAQQNPILDRFTVQQIEFYVIPFAISSNFSLRQVSVLDMNPYITKNFLKRKMFMVFFSLEQWKFSIYGKIPLKTFSVFLGFTVIWNKSFCLSRFASHTIKRTNTE